MIGVDTAAVPAEVVEFGARRRIHAEQSVYHSVCILTAAIGLDYTVAVAVCRGCPEPAPVIRDLDLGRYARGKVSEHVSPQPVWKYLERDIPSA